MIIQENPFTSEVYNQHWIENFSSISNYHSFPFINDLNFVKSKYIPLYQNIGKFKSAGISYSLSKEPDSNNLGNGVLLIYDVPKYFQLDFNNSGNLKILKSEQYKGYVIRLSEYADIANFLQKTFTSKERGNKRRNLKKLESSFSITYDMYYGETSKKIFNEVFEELYALLRLQYGDGNNNSHTPEGIKNWHKKLWFDLINKKKGSFFVIRQSNKPISISFNYHAKNILFEAVPALDPEYRKYGVGNVHNLKLIDWALDNGYHYFDLGKGSYGYKDMWCNLIHDYEYHIIINRKSLISSAIGWFLYRYFQNKNKMRKLYHKIRGYN